MRASRFVYAVTKRGGDIVIASVLLFLALPVIAVVALAIAVESPGPILYRARRIGRRGRPLDMLKFRKMHDGATGRPLSLADDERFTRVGRWLGRTKLDELPQLLNVIKGDMSLVGPRPEDPWFVQRHLEEFAPILEVRPGITGLSQLAFRTEPRILDRDDPIGHYESRILPQKLHLDNLYVARSNPLLDLRILGWTFSAMLLSIPVSVNRSTARMTPRRGRGGQRQDPRACRSRSDVDELATSPLASCGPTTPEG